MIKFDRPFQDSVPFPNDTASESEATGNSFPTMQAGEVMLAACGRLCCGLFQIHARRHSCFSSSEQRSEVTIEQSDAVERVASPFLSETRSVKPRGKTGNPRRPVDGHDDLKKRPRRKSRPLAYQNTELWDELALLGSQLPSAIAGKTATT